ncbi:MOSC domain-containing protein [Paenibacillus sp. N1-5-1-14]|uniref:MOSC domain-containing protein n=1 Tax=Paenibacillus radicibacter TaxID=2972488 RepID=UPI00215970F5|nr:MOSC domain-containing protein [Paenibacillus radicibacter]MCR8643217.1 MOSC domain-containing protein [Paenibacillus radicibacter]
MTARKLVSLNIGMPITVPHNRTEVTTGIFKKPVSEGLMLTKLGFIGDGQADTKHHGGPDKAVCAFCYEHFPYWTEQLGREMEFGAFGENITLEGMLEGDVCIGDTFKLGEAVVQITQPRQPCFKLSVRYEAPKLPVQMQDTGYTGFYFRVLEEGIVTPDAKLELMSRHELGVTVDYANRIMHHEKTNVEGMQTLLAVDALSESWRATFNKRIDGVVIDTSERLEGKSSS